MLGGFPRLILAQSLNASPFFLLVFYYEPYHPPGIDAKLKQNKLLQNFILEEGAGIRPHSP